MVIDLTPAANTILSYVMKKLMFAKKRMVLLLLIPKCANLELMVKLVKEGKLKSVIDLKHPLARPGMLGRRDYTSLSLRAAFSDESSANSYTKDGPDSVITYEETKPVEKEEEIMSVDKEEKSILPFEEGFSDDNVSELVESFLAKLDIEKLDSDDKYSLPLLGLGGFTVLYLATAVVGAIDSFPLLPKLMQVVGVSYTAWFTARYLVLKENREELTMKV